MKKVVDMKKVSRTYKTGKDASYKIRKVKIEVIDGLVRIVNKDAGVRLEISHSQGLNKVFPSYKVVKAKGEKV